MTNKEMVAKLIDIAKNYKTLYVHGCFGAPMTAKNKTRYTQNTDYNRQPARTAKINAASADTFGFDCVCLLKGVLWGWNGDKNKVYGGAVYTSNGVPDIGADSMIKVCKDVSTDFSKIEPGEAVWMEGHIGMYVGDGLAVECTPKWEDKVQITACNCSKTGYNRRNWTKHGKLPYLTYVKDEAPVEPVPAPEPVKPEPSADTPAPTEGAVVEFKSDADRYYPTGSKIPGWVKTDYTHVVTQITSRGKEVVKGGKKCVLLGRKIRRKDGVEEPGINTWTDLDVIRVLSGGSAGTPVTPAETVRTHTVVRGDTLWGIAKKYLGSGYRYTEIVTLNGLKSTTIYAGQVLKIPQK